MAVARTQTLVQLTDDLVARLDERAARQSRTRSSLIREALQHYLEDELEADIDRRIVEGYRRMPQGPEEEAWARQGAREAISRAPAPSRSTTCAPFRARC